MKESYNIDNEDLSAIEFDTSDICAGCGKVIKDFQGLTIGSGTYCGNCLDEAMEISDKKHKENWKSFKKVFPEYGDIGIEVFILPEFKDRLEKYFKP